MYELLGKSTRYWGKVGELGSPGRDVDRGVQLTISPDILSTVELTLVSRGHFSPD